MIDEMMTEEASEESEMPEAYESETETEEEGAFVIPKSFFGEGRKAGDVIQIRITGMDSDGDYTVERNDMEDSEEPESIEAGVKKAFETEPPSREAMMALKKGRM
jgi:hypothetical protein